MSAAAAARWRQGRSCIRIPGRLPLPLLALVLAMATLCGCSTEPAEQRLRATIGDMEAAVESGDVGGFLAGVSSDFNGNGGEYDRRRLHAMLRAISLRHRDVGVVLGPLDITLHGDDRATVGVDAVVTGGSGGLLPESARRLRVDSGWRLEGGDWRCISARWTQ